MIEAYQLTKFALSRLAQYAADNGFEVDINLGLSVTICLCSPLTDNLNDQSKRDSLDSPMRCLTFRVFCVLGKALIMNWREVSVPLH